MHELGIVMNVLEQVDSVAAEYKAEKVTKVTMEVGEVSSIVPDLFIDAFNWAKKKTDYLKDAELEMIIIEGRTYCQSCGGTYKTTEYGKKCPHCGTEGETKGEGTVLRCSHCGKEWSMAANCGAFGAGALLILGRKRFQRQ